METATNKSNPPREFGLLHKSKTQALYYEVGQAIVNGVYGTEKRIPAMREISAEYNCSRIIVREAIQILKSKGMVYTNMSQGILINPQVEWNLLDNDILHWLSRADFSPSLMRELNQVVFAVEPSCIQLVAQRASNKTIERIEEAVIRIEVAHVQYLNLLDEQIRFHSEILYASSNRFYKQFKTLIDVAMRYNKKFNDSHQIAESQSTKEYRIIFNHISNRDQRGAKNALERLLKKITPNGHI